MYLSWRFGLAGEPHPNNITPEYDRSSQRLLRPQAECDADWKHHNC